MVCYGYHVGGKQEIRGKIYRAVKYIDSKGKDHDRMFLCDENGNFKSKVYGAVDEDGEPTCNCKESAMDLSESDRQANRASYRAKVKDGSHTPKKRTPKAPEAPRKRLRAKDFYIKND